MKVLKFSLGFGPKLLTKQGKETEYSLRAVPLGGFVQLEGEEEDSNDERAFVNRPIWQRILVLLAGVTMNIILALFIYLCIYMSINEYTTSTVSSESSENALQLTQIMAGDTIYKINNEKIYNDADVSRIIDKATSDDFKFEVIDANGNHKNFESTIPKTKIGYIGVAFDNNTVYLVLPNGSAEKAGFKAGDKLISIDNIKYDSILDALNNFKNNPNTTFKVQLLRDEKEIELEVTTEAIEKRTVDLKFVEEKDLDFIHNFKYAWNETKYYLRANLIALGELARGKSETAEVTGIVGISKQISQTETFIEFFYMMSAISLSLGIMNLLPIPGLDGGKLLITFIEIIRRKPMSKETEAKITLMGFSVLMALMIYVTIGDIVNLFK